MSHIRRKEGIAYVRGVQIWYESFGDPHHPALLLIMGACCQGILWPLEFCDQLVEAGFYVIRYDHRDTGDSSYFEFNQHPYSHVDMAKDALGLLDFLDIQKVHLFGLSAGGSIGMIISTLAPWRILSLGLMATSLEFRPLRLALENLPLEAEQLPGPSLRYLKWMYQWIEKPPLTQQELLEQRLEGWRLLTGSCVVFEEEKQHQMHQQFLLRAHHPEKIKNHLLANYCSEKIIREVAYQVTVPTVILHGSEDPIFSVEHGRALAQAIPCALYYELKGMGHVPHCSFYSIMLRCIQENVKRSQFKKE